MQVLYVILGIAGALAIVWAGAFFYGWHSNAVAGTHYDIPQLNQFFKNMTDSVTALAVNQSVFNTQIPWLDSLIGRFIKPKGAGDIAKTDIPQK